MSDLLFHPTTRRNIDLFVAHPSHALILSGPEGIGKNSISIYLAGQLLGLESDANTDTHPNIKVLATEEKSISIDEIRELTKFVKLKSARGTGQIRRVVIVGEAHKLTAEAQNAFLKLLEEPPEDTVILLTSSNELQLLPTIRSRAQIVRINPPQNDELTKYFWSKNYPAQKIQRALLMSDGLPGLMTALLDQDETHPLIIAVNTARDILKANTFTRLCMMESIVKQKTDLSRILRMLNHMSHAAIVQTAAKGNDKGLQSWHKIHMASYEALRALQTNAQPKLVLLNLMLEL